jgi:dTDP-4-amino-4,6-dideoxygalactose transaminase
MDVIEEQRQAIFHNYYEALTPLAEKGLLKLPVIPPECKSNSHMFHIILEDEQTRDALMNYLKSTGILTVFHYLPLHLSPMGLSMGYREGQFPVTEHISSRLLRLPFYYNLTREELAKVTTCIELFFKGK